MSIIHNFRQLSVLYDTYMPGRSANSPSPIISLINVKIPCRRPVKRQTATILNRTEEESFGRGKDVINKKYKQDTTDTSSDESDYLSSRLLRQPLTFYKKKKTITVQDVKNIRDAPDYRAVHHTEQCRFTRNILKAPIILIEEYRVTKIKIHFLGNIGEETRKTILTDALRLYCMKLAVGCSWLGHRNQFRMCDLQSINSIKTVIVQAYRDLKMNEFELVASEWIRLAKLRLNRQKKNDNE
ncbi:hypothetical protein NQ317_015639 [Molorchus minor]|uniref:DUF4806 domain-containing protein n=1 Tax=Molorchus minor TaxID=1323400 RepID=A0ABQ9JUN4_9CUCU|nr:hypothetical protein NQ317_015639 [Molorchus minor]